jgi:hypothetical protein
MTLTQTSKRSYTNIGKKSISVFLDTNIAIDLVTRQPPFYDECQFIEKLIDQRYVRPWISSGTVTTMIYLVFNRFKLPNANKELISFFEKCQISETAKPIVMKAMHSVFRDKEDAYQYYSALKLNADYFLTRDMKDFKSVVPWHLPVLTPLQFEYMLL